MKKIMKLDECTKCSYFLDNRADCVLCKFGGEIEHRVTDGEKVVSCPKNK